MTSWRARWRLKSPASRLFAQAFVQVQIKENIKAPHHWPLWGESTGDRWIPLTKGQWRGKCFHLMISLWPESNKDTKGMLPSETVLKFVVGCNAICILRGMVCDIRLSSGNIVVADGLAPHREWPHMIENRNSYHSLYSRMVNFLRSLHHRKMCWRLPKWQMPSPHIEIMLSVKLTTSLCQCRQHQNIQQSFKFHSDRSFFASLLHPNYEWTFEAAVFLPSLLSVIPYCLVNVEFSTLVQLDPRLCRFLWTSLSGPPRPSSAVFSHSGHSPGISPSPRQTIAT